MSAWTCATRSIACLALGLVMACGSNASNLDDGGFGGGSGEDGPASDGTTGGEGGHASEAGTTVDSGGDSTTTGGGDSSTSNDDASADGGAGPGDSGVVIVDAGPTLSQTCDGGTTSVSGTVYAPNGTDPIPNVRVYAAATILPFPAIYCDQCNAPLDPAYDSTKSSADGKFMLTLDDVPASAASITFTIQIGRFRKHTSLPITPCTSATVPAADETLPGTSAAGDIPTIAVSSGNVDHLDAVLTSLGITQYDCFEGRKTAGASTSTCNEATAATTGKNIADVISDGSNAGLPHYQMLFLSCAPGAYAQFITNHTQATMTANMSDWVGRGGRVLVTDTAYDYVAQPFPSEITWAGPAGSPQPVDGANQGCAPGTNPHATAYTTKIDDMTLAAWLQVVGIIPTPPPSPPTVQIQGYYQPWSQMVSTATTTTLVADGTMPIDPTYSSTSCATPAMKDVPLSATFNVLGCGRVDFSSFHTYTGTGASSATANEKIMEYEIFQAATCQL
jgi:hypothetical protein